AVVFLRWRCQLVLRMAVFGVSRNRCDRREASLVATAPSQTISIVTGLVLAHEYAGGDHAPKIHAGLGVDRAIIGINRRIKIDLGLGDMQKAPWLALYAVARFQARKHIVGRRKNVSRAPRRRPQCAKGLNQSQWGSLSCVF